MAPGRGCAANAEVARAGRGRAGDSLWARTARGRGRFFSRESGISDQTPNEQNTREMIQPEGTTCDNSLIPHPKKQRLSGRL